MANVNSAFGLRPLNITGSAPNSEGVTAYRILSTNTDKIWQGTMVIGANDGYIVRSSASGTTQNPVGVFGGCEYVDAVSREPKFSNYWPGSGALSTAPIIAYVYDNPMQQFLIAASAAFASAAAAQAAVFGNANLAVGNTGTDATGISLGTLDVSTVTTTANHLLRIVGFSDEAENNDVLSAGAGVIVRFNRHFNNPVGTTTGLHA